jgi:hypothetical protein
MGSPVKWGDLREPIQDALGVAIGQAIPEIDVKVIGIGIEVRFKIAVGRARRNIVLGACGEMLMAEETC